MTVKYCTAISDFGGVIGRKCRKPFKPKTMKTSASKYRAMTEAIFMTFSFLALSLVEKTSIQRGKLSSYVHVKLAPPSTRMVWPLTQAPSSENKKAIIAAMSSGTPRRGDH